MILIRKPLKIHQYHLIHILKYSYYFKRDIAELIFSQAFSSRSIDDAYDILKQKALVHFMTTSYIRGITLKNAVIIIDECQNMSFHELDSIITRVGEDCRVIFCGDFRQADLQKNGLQDFIKILKAMDCFDLVEFEIKDIVRSGFVRDYITAKTDLGL